MAIVNPGMLEVYNEVPKEIRILVLTIGNNIVEVVWDPDYMSVFNL